MIRICDLVMAAWSRPQADNETENIRPVGGNTLGPIKYASRHLVPAFSSNLVDIKVLRSDIEHHELQGRKKHNTKGRAMMVSCKKKSFRKVKVHSLFSHLFFYQGFATNLEYRRVMKKFSENWP